ncbi:MAG: DUF4270 domain-containing protein [Prolixibacteraceae bacterium]|nr:DUF4270 domain-containing protein [Prolixibacteraceae bacterium]
MKKEHTVIYKFVIGFACLSIALFSCTDDMSKAGLGLLPTGDLVKVGKVIEKETIKAYTFTDEKQRTDEPAYNLLGTFNDPIFGKTTADFACQFRLSGYPDFSKNAQVDSLVLYLLYMEIYGDTITPQRFKVYELASDLDIDQKYYQDVNLKGMAKGEILANKVYTPKFKLDSLSNNYGSTKKNPKDTVIQELAIKLDSKLIQKLMSADSLTWSSNDKFMNFFKGLYVEAGDMNQGGSIMKIYTLASGSRMVMHYHNSEKDSLTYYYNINENAARVNRFSHDYSNTKFAANMDKTVNQDSLIYLQTTGGLRTKIMIPELESWTKLIPNNTNSSAHIVINQAELIFQVDTIATDTAKYVVPQQLVLTAIDKDGKEYLPSDVAFSSSYYGGAYNNTDKTYRFNIAKHMQEVIDNVKDKENNGFYLSTAFRSSMFRRVVLKGATSKTGIKLEITYSIIE